jgi:hypothetical protein
MRIAVSIGSVFALATLLSLFAAPLAWAQASVADSKPVLVVYRPAPQPIGACDTVGVTVFGDHSGAAVHIRLMASGGTAVSETAIVPGSDADVEPTWPQWISPEIDLDFRGWRTFTFPVSKFASRAPANQGAAPAPDIATADTFGIDLTDVGETALFETPTWSSSSANSSAPVVIDDFSGGVGAWLEHGTPEAVQDARIALATDPSNAGRSALSISFADAKTARSKALAAARAALSATKAGYLTYVPQSPFRRILPDSLPEPSEIAAPIEMFACANQTESSSLCIYAAKDMDDVTVSPLHALTQGAHKIDSSRIDIRVVKVWTRPGAGKYRDPDEIGPTPELLVKDDRAPIGCDGGVLPGSPLSGNPITTVSAGQSKQFWVSVHVPGDAAPGDYATKLVVSGPSIASVTVPLDVEVMPMTLMGPSKQYIFGMNCRDSADSSDQVESPAADESLDDGVFADELEDIHAHGFLYSTLMDAPANLFGNAFADYKSAALGMLIIYNGLSGSIDADLAASAQIESERKATAVDSVAYLAPSGPGTPDELAAFHKQRLTTAAFVRSADQFAAEVDSLDMPIYSVDEPYVQQLLSSGGVRISGKYDYWFWPAYEPDPRANRLYAGYLLYRSNLYGAYVPNDAEPLAGDPYTDEQPNSTAPDEAGLNTRMLIYPVRGGVLDTVQWEAVQAGINDMRYLTTFYAALRECKDNHVALGLVAHFEPQVKAIMAKPFWRMTDVQYQQDRRIIAHDAVMMRTALNSFYARGTAPTPAKKARPAHKSGSKKS